MEAALQFLLTITTIGVALGFWWLFLEPNGPSDHD